MGIRDILSRAASLLVLAAYVAVAAFGDVPDKIGGPAFLGTVVGLLLIWFPEQIANTIIPSNDRPAPSTETPPVLVAFMGWVFLVGVPTVIALLVK